MKAWLGPDNFQTARGPGYQRFLKLQDLYIKIQPMSKAEGPEITIKQARHSVGTTQPF